MPLKLSAKLTARRTNVRRRARRNVYKSTFHFVSRILHLNPFSPTRGRCLTQQPLFSVPFCFIAPFDSYSLSLKSLYPNLRIYFTSPLSSIVQIAGKAIPLKVLFFTVVYIAISQKVSLSPICNGFSNE